MSNPELSKPELAARILTLPPEQRKRAMLLTRQLYQGGAAPAKEGSEPPEQWEPWLRTLFPAFVTAPFGPRHIEFWDWLWSIEPITTPRPFVGVWPRAGGKSSSAELGAVALGVRDKRRYGIYVRATQDRADDSVGNIAVLLESPAIDQFYPGHAARGIGKYGDSRGWRRNRLSTSGGFTIDALGLDVAGRGLKVAEQRPDFIIFDDIDGRHDTPLISEKKLTTIKETVLPSGTANTVVIAIQNLVVAHGVFSQIVDGKTDCLARRVLSGPEPALRGLRVESVEDPETGLRRAVIREGTATWAGQDRAGCQALMDLIGYLSFERECQQQVQERTGALWARAMINRVAVAPPMKRIVIGVDPSGGTNEVGIVAGGLGYDNKAYVLADKTADARRGPFFWGRQVADLYHELKADKVVAEKNFGGDMVKGNLLVADKHLPVALVSASRGKAVRAEPVASLYSDGRVFHVGDLPELEIEMTSWVPGDPTSPNRLDALVWMLTDLMLGARAGEAPPPVGIPISAGPYSV